MHGLSAVEQSQPFLGLELGGGEPSPPQCLQALQALAAKYPDYGPLPFLLSEEFSDTKRGEQSVADKRAEKEWLEKFRAAHADGKFLKYFLDKKEAQKWLDSAQYMLRDIEVLGYSHRLRAVALDNQPFLADIDGTRLAAERDYHSLSLEVGVAEFVAARTENIAFLRSLPDCAFERRGEMEAVGCVTLAKLAEMLKNHDAVHRREIQELLSR